MAIDKPRICCLDLDTFFVSVERLLDPSLVGQPVVVGGRPGSRGVVTAASYEVRAFGVKSGMSLTEAQRLAPHARFIPTRHGLYSEYADAVRELTGRYSPVIRIASIDEQFIDFSGCERMYRASRDASDDDAILRVVREMTDAIRREIGLPSSAGIATSKSVAKIASGIAKPAGVRMIPAGSENAFLAPLPARKFPGIGPVAERKLARIGIHTLGDLAAADPDALSGVFGVLSKGLWRGARGEGSASLGRERPAFYEYDPARADADEEPGEARGDVGSISNERTFREDVGDAQAVLAQLCSLAERVCYRARKRGVKARCVTVKLRYADFETISRSRTISATSSEFELYPTVQSIYWRARTRLTPIRLVGVQLSKLGYYDDQLPLFDGDEALCGAVDEVRKRFGYDAVRLALPHDKARRSRHQALTPDREEP